MASGFHQMTDPQSSRDAGGASGEGRPPSARAVNYTLPWFHFLMVLGLVIAWSFPLKVLISRWLWPPVETGPRTESVFAAIVYEGVSDKTNEVNATRFRDHLRALGDHGFVPITLRDVRDLLYENKPLPEKSVLLTFDHSRKSSYFETKAILRRQGWNAAMFVWTDPVEAEDPAALLWPYLRGMARARRWEIGAQSYRGYDGIPSDPFGKKGWFMTSRKWLAEEQRYETVDEYRERLEADHVACIRRIREEVGVRPIAYAYPYGDFGQYRRQAQVVRKTNLDLVGKYYDLGFLTGNFAINTQSSDPRRLNRLHVPEDWSGDKLVRALERSWPSQSDIAIDEPAADPDAWIVDWGRGKPDAEGMLLQAEESITGARMWMTGTALRKDFHLTLDFRLIEGQMGVYLRGSPDEEEYVYFGIDTEGSVWLRQKHAGLEPFTLASTKRRMPVGERHALDIFTRGRLMGATLDGVSLFDERILLHGDPRPGMLGLSVWDRTPGRAAVVVRNAVVRDQKPTLLTVDQHEEEILPYITKWVHRNGFRMTHLSPTWLSMNSRGFLSDLYQHEEVYKALSKIYRMKLLPRIEVNDYEQWPAVLSPRQLARRAGEIKAEGIFVDMTRVTAATTPQVASWLQEMQSMLEEHGGGELLVKFPRAMENATMLQPIFAVMPGLHFAATSESPVRDGVPAAATEPVDTEAIPPPRGDEGLPFNYQIDERALARGDLTPRDQMYELRREGQAAFQEGRYAEALDIWTKWHRLAPRDPAPLMLIGDVHMRMGNTELALERYRDSLDLDPGRISLAMRYARLLEREGRDEESIQLMNTYATLFPENPDILIAQSDWLARHNRYQEARNLINYALVLRPNDIDILVAALRLSDDSAERKDIIQRMVRVGDRPDMYLEFGEAIGRYQLLSMPDAHLLTPVIDRICNTTSNEQVHALFCRYQMLTEPVRESFNMNTLSESWKIYGGIVSFERQGQLQIQADPTHREASIQLEGSERTRDGHIEAGLLEWIGQFWLIARRGDGQFIRFGFDENNDLYLQSWVGGQNVSSQRRFWSGFTTPINLRLEIRGFSAMGFINGRRAFDVPLSIPHNLGLGSWGVAAHSPRFGTAKAELDHIRIGPLPANIAVAPPESPPDYLEKLKANIRHLSAISPEWFSVTAEGQIVENVRDENDILHILSRFHGIRLMPVMKISRLAGVPVEQLPALAAKYKVDGFVLEFPQLPDNDWFLELETMPGLSALQILALAIDQESMTASARGIGMGIGLLPANQSEVKTLVKYWDDFYDSLASEQTGIEHNILLYNPEEIP